MPLVRVTTGGPDIPADTYPVTLIAVEGPFTITPQSGPKAGKEMSIFTWKFAVDEGDYDGTELEGTTSTNTSPRSHLYEWVTALTRKAPELDSDIELSELAGRRALGEVKPNASGWMKVASLTAMPAAMLSRGVAAAAGAPLREQDRQRAQPAANTVRGRATQGSDGVPF